MAEGRAFAPPRNLRLKRDLRTGSRPAIGRHSFPHCQAARQLFANRKRGHAQVESPARPIDVCASAHRFFIIKLMLLTRVQRNMSFARFHSSISAGGIK
jgi:hypothetical protein